MKLITAITGTGDITYNNAAALLNDYLPFDDVLVYVPSYMTSEGIKVVVQWLKDANINMERVKKPQMSSYLMGNPDAEAKSLIVLGVDGSEDIIAEVREENIPVLDLTRALFSVSPAGASETHIPLYGSESKSQPLSEASGTPMGSEKDHGLEFVTETLTDRMDRLENEMKELREQMTDPRMVSGNIAAGMRTTAEDDIGAGETGFHTGVSTEGTERYYRNGKGKIRKAGRSKIKPGEKEVWLTDEEVESATSQ